MTTSRQRRLAGTALGVLVFIAALCIWEVWARAAGSFLVPTASEVAEQAWEIWPTSAFLGEAGASLKRLAVGFVIAAVIGIGIGLLVGTSQAARRTLEPFLELLRAVPAIAIVPAAIVILGVGDAQRIAVIAFGLCFPILVNTAEGVRLIPPEVRDTASMLHVGRVERIFRVYFPAALPSIMAGLRIAVSIGLILVVVSEFVGEGNGLGHYLLVQRSTFAVPEMYAGILFLGLLGYVLNRLFLVVERRVLAWHYGAAGG
jgi:ABC-type nitrate/sulfonate/bicarbonate transport system permease component